MITLLIILGLQQQPELTYHHSAALDHYYGIQQIKSVRPPAEKIIWMNVTAYSAGDEHTPGVIMANGEHVYEGAVACNDLPLGTTVVIDGKCYKVCDRMARDGMLDIYMSDKRKALEYGVKRKKIIILEE